jgi:hypothetical protein
MARPGPADQGPSQPSSRQKLGSEVSGVKRRTAVSSASCIIPGRSFVGGSLRTSFGRRDAPSPASGQWPTSPSPSFSAVGHKSLPPAGSGPANDRLNALLARPKGRAYNCLCHLDRVQFPLIPHRAGPRDIRGVVFLKKAELSAGLRAPRPPKSRCDGLIANR